jgi:myo-inositol-1(or 4)-monophosphatase
MSTALTASNLEDVRGLMRAAGAEALKGARARNALEVTFKGGPSDPVSACDLVVEEQLRTALSRLFPADRFWGEEVGMPQDPGRGRVWICDPIDGTRSFLRFGRNFCVSLGLLLDGVAVAAFIFDPIGDDLYEARLGEGAWLNGERLQQPPLQDLSHAIVGIGHSQRVPPDDQVAFLSHVLNGGALTHQHGSGALALAQTGAGRLDAYVELHMNAWDALPGLLIAKEAGADCIAWPADRLTHGYIVLAANPAIASTLRGWIDLRPR